MKKHAQNTAEIFDVEKQLTLVRKHVLKADYKSGLRIVRLLRAKAPGDFKVEYTYAKVLGDYADELPISKRKKLKLEASRILEKLLRRMKGQAEEVRFGTRINYYYQTQRFRDLERVGAQLAKTNRSNGLYASGLGASLEAESLAKKNSATSLRKAKRTAERAIKHFAKYFQLNPRETYYFPYSLQAMSFAILGDLTAMEKALSKAAKLSARKLNYWEFEEVRKLAKTLRSK